jgi:hypothetical protein
MIDTRLLDCPHNVKAPAVLDAVETEALGQREIQRLLTERLDEMLPEPLEVVWEREERQRELVRELLEGPTH